MIAPIIMWFRRDLRLKDNTALTHALEQNAPIIPLFILDTRLLQSEYIGTPRLAFLLQALTSLDNALKALKTRLLVRQGEPLPALQHLISETGAQKLYFNRDYSPYSRKRDEQITANVPILVQSYDDNVLMPPNAVLKSDKSPYVVFTPYKNVWNAIQPKPPISEVLPHPQNFYSQDKLNNLGVPTLESLGHPALTINLPPAQETHAHDLLYQFITRDIYHYNDTRNGLPINPFGTPRPIGTSYLSPYLRLGILSPRHAYHNAREAYATARTDEQKESIQAWVSELTWREFYTQIMYHFPHVLERDFINTYHTLEWRNALDELEAWKEGQTGYPIVDAPMRQLKAIGWMPNRARMIVASFLTKHLLIHWKHGEKHFMKHLIDGDPASNNGGWQWSAGTGTDAQPYFRIFNPTTQSQKFATPAYLRHWIPELAQIADKFIHTPHLATIPPKNYPKPIVQHEFARQRTLNAFKQARGENQ